MIEIEVKLKIKDCDVLEKHLLGQGYKLTETLRETDTYFDGGINGIKKSGQALRVRRTVNCVTGKEQSAITFKGKKIDTVSMARLELETGVESGEAAERILCALGFYPVQPIVVKTRKILKNGNICACLDDVQGLGTFLELEIMAESEAARPAALDRIEGILKNIGYTMADTTRASYLSQLQKMGENMRTNEYYIKLGKKLCKMLRHRPEQYGLILDEYGWGNVSEILKALHKYATWQDVTEEDIAETVRTDNKGRFELSRGNIRALYGHSFPVKILKPVAAPPEILYHGTSHKAAELILEGGLLPMGRQYAHLSPDIETAFKVGRRKEHDPVILKIDAARANEDGVVFYIGNDITWLADRVPPRYITVLQK